MLNRKLKKKKLFLKPVGWFRKEYIMNVRITCGSNCRNLVQVKGFSIILHLQVILFLKAFVLYTYLYLKKMPIDLHHIAQNMITRSTLMFSKQSVSLY